MSERVKLKTEKIQLSPALRFPPSSLPSGDRSGFPPIANCPAQQWCSLGRKGHDGCLEQPRDQPQQQGLSFRNFSGQSYPRNADSLGCMGLNLHRVMEHRKRGVEMCK